jgi:hypothetical protein
LELSNSTCVVAVVASAWRSTVASYPASPVAGFGTKDVGARIVCDLLEH